METARKARFAVVPFGVCDDSDAWAYAIQDLTQKLTEALA